MQAACRSPRPIRGDLSFGPETRGVPSPIPSVTARIGRHRHPGNSRAGCVTTRRRAPVSEPDGDEHRFRLNAATASALAGTTTAGATQFCGSACPTGNGTGVTGRLDGSGQMHVGKRCVISRQILGTNVCLEVRPAVTSDWTGCGVTRGLSPLLAKMAACRYSRLTGTFGCCQPVYMGEGL